MPVPKSPFCDKVKTKIAAITFLFEFYLGHSVFGDHGELVCTKPFPSMPVCFWNDPNHVKYRNAYFSKFEGKAFFFLLLPF